MQHTGLLLVLTFMGGIAVGIRMQSAAVRGAYRLGGFYVLARVSSNHIDDDTAARLVSEISAEAEKLS